MADIAVQATSRTGLNPTFSNAAPGGDAFLNSGLEWLVLRSVNTSTAITVTIATTDTVDGQSLADRTVVVPIVVSGAQEILCGPFPKNIYNDGMQKVQLTYSTNTDLKVAVVKRGDL